MKTNTPQTLKIQMNTRMSKFDLKILREDIRYAVDVLAGHVASDLADGDLAPPKTARCRTRGGFRAWLRRMDNLLEIPSIANRIDCLDTKHS